MAHVDSWESIKKHGLLSTTALLDLFEISGKPRFAIEAQYRPECVTISHPKYGTAVIRDNKPLPESKLSCCLTDMTPRQWYKILNRRVFFWPSLNRVLGLLDARAYRSRSHTIITFESRQILAAYSENVFLSRINSGSAIYKPTPRGKTTFVPLAEWPADVGPRSGKLKNPIAELAVDYNVPNVREFTVKVEEMRSGQRGRVIWLRED